MREGEGRGFFASFLLFFLLLFFYFLLFDSLSLYSLFGDSREEWENGLEDNLYRIMKSLPRIITIASGDVAKFVPLRLVAGIFIFLFKLLSYYLFLLVILRCSFYIVMNTTSFISTTFSSL